MQGGKNWILPKETNANRFFCDSHWLEIWKNHVCPSMGRNGGIVAMDLFLFQCANTIGAGGIGAPIVVARGASVRQYIGAPMPLSANRQCLPSMVSKLCFADFFFMFGPPLLLAQGASVRQ